MTGRDSLSAHKAALRELYPDPEAIYRKARQRRHKRRLAGVAALALGVSALVGFDPAYRTQDFETAAAEHRDWTLDDGSRLSLNTDSVLQVQWRLRSRRLKLLRGEAAFDVAHSPLRAFSVSAGDARITDIGTVFSVRRSDAGLRVRVLSGEVEVRSPAGTQFVVAGSGLVIRPGRPAESYAVRERDLAWREGRIVFDGTPLAEALAELGYYRSAPITLVDAQVAQLRISGQFDTARPDALLDALPKILPVELRRAGDGSVEIGMRQR